MTVQVRCDCQSVILATRDASTFSDLVISDAAHAGRTKQAKNTSGAGHAKDERRPGRSLIIHARNKACMTQLVRQAPVNPCCFQFRSPTLPTFTLPAVRPNSPGDVALHVYHPIRLVSGGAARNCSSAAVSCYDTATG